MCVYIHIYHVDAPTDVPSRSIVYIYIYIIYIYTYVCIYIHILPEAR